MTDTTGKYYNHDAIWQRRVDQGNPIWGSQNNKVYFRMRDYIRRDFPSSSTIKVLDVGCGAGALGQVLKVPEFDYTGCDESEVAISLGQRFFPECQLRHIDMADALSCNLFEEASFDAVVSINVLHCLVDPLHRMTFLTNCRKVVKKSGGLMYLTTMKGPVKLGHKQNQAPRVYKTTKDILDEFVTCGWKGIEVLSDIPAFGRSLIPNLHMKAWI